MISNPLKTTDPRHNHIMGLSPVGFHKIAYTEWGDPDNTDVLVCVHGLTRNSRDFDFLAKELAKDYRIICPDILGRGDSDHTGNPSTYNYPQYLNDMVALLARINVDTVNWLGTSMGGIIGMMLASQPNNPIKKLIINDVGFMVPKKAIQRIAKYTQLFPKFASLEDARPDLLGRLSTFGALGPEQFEHLLKHSFRNEAGFFVYHHDPAIIEALLPAVNVDIHLEAFWKAIKCPTYVIHGVLSDLLIPDVLKQMLAVKPDTLVAEIPNTGHAPSLMMPDQIEIIQTWLKL
jgi:pimeloyl-ACP methyl ester carboxylesterase